MNFRSTPGRRIKWLNTGTKHHFSNFVFVDTEYNSEVVMRRIMSLARKHGFQSVLVEGIDEADCALLAAENEAIRRRRPAYVGSVVHRLSFFRCRAEETPKAEDFIGYAVFKWDHFGAASTPTYHVYEAVLPSFRSASWNNFLHCGRTYEINTCVGSFSVHGDLYAQQNDCTFVCAHVAVRSVLAAMLPDKDITYEAINGFCGIDHQQTYVGDGHGLSPEQIELVFDGLGIEWKKLVHEPDENIELAGEFHSEIYGFVESGKPVLLGFELSDPQGQPSGRHVIPVIGHTFNEDTWLPDAQRDYFGTDLGYYPSENWLSSFVVHDDNFGPYYCLPRTFLTKRHGRLMYGFLGSGVVLTATQVEAYGIDFLVTLAQHSQPRGEDWFDRFRIYALRKSLVLRTLMVKREDYISHLRSLSDGQGNGLEDAHLITMERSLPDRFWLVEASAQELFAASRRKFGDVLLTCDHVPGPNSLLSEFLLGYRLPGAIYIPQNNQLTPYSTALMGHTALFTLPHLSP